MIDGFYRAFEERHYAPREVIKTLRRQYLPFVTPLVVAYPGAPTFDIGCGRGEWLELMMEIGLKPYGVDLDEGMLNDCVVRNLPAEKGDAVAFLTTLSSESQVVVSALHVVEHISFEQLRTVVSEALRVLKPGGLLIMETPNPENLVVATRNFYLDPAHQRPIPPQLLAFLSEYYGFKRVKTLRLQESPALSGEKVLTLLDVLSGVSPDYAVVAQKDGATEIFAATNPAFEAEYGLTLESLAVRYNQQAEAKAQRAETVAQKAEAKAQRAETVAQKAEAKAQRAEVVAQHASTWFVRRRLKPTRTDVVVAYWCLLGREPENESVVLGYMQKKTIDELIAAFMSSEEFKNRMNKSGSSQTEYNSFFSFRKKLLSYPFALAVHFFRKRPGFRLRCVALIKRFGLYDTLRSFYSRCSGHQDHENSPNVMGQGAVNNSSVDQLTPRARQIYADLQAAIERRQKENR